MMAVPGNAMDLYPQYLTLRQNLATKLEIPLPEVPAVTELRFLGAQSPLQDVSTLDNPGSVVHPDHPTILLLHPTLSDPPNTNLIFRLRILRELTPAAYFDHPVCRVMMYLSLLSTTSLSPFFKVWLDRLLTQTAQTYKDILKTANQQTEAATLSAIRAYFQLLPFDQFFREFLKFVDPNRTASEIIAEYLVFLSSKYYRLSLTPKKIDALCQIQKTTADLFHPPPQKQNTSATDPMMLIANLKFVSYFRCEYARLGIANMMCRVSLNKKMDPTKTAEFFRNAFLINPYFIFLQKTPTYIVCFILLPDSAIPRLRNYFETFLQHGYITRFVLDPIQINRYIVNSAPTKKQLESFSMGYYNKNYSVDVANNLTLNPTPEFLNYPDLLVITTIRKIMLNLETYSHGQFNGVITSLHDAVKKALAEIKSLFSPIRVITSFPRIFIAIMEDMKTTGICYTKQLLLTYPESPLSKNVAEKRALLQILDRLGYYKLIDITPGEMNLILREVETLREICGGSVKKSDLENHFFRMLYTTTIRSSAIQNLDTSLILYHPFLKLRLVSSKRLDLLVKMGILVNETVFGHEIWTILYLKNEDFPFFLPFLYRWYEEEIWIADIPSTAGDNIHALIGLFNPAENQWKPTKLCFEDDVRPFTKYPQKVHYGVMTEEKILSIPKIAFPPLPPPMEGEFWTALEHWTEMGREQISITSATHGFWVEFFTSLLSTTPSKPPIMPSKLLTAHPNHPKFFASLQENLSSIYFPPASSAYEKVVIYVLYDGDHLALEHFTAHPIFRYLCIMGLYDLHFFGFQHDLRIIAEYWLPTALLDNRHSEIRTLFTLLERLPNTRITIIRGVNVHSFVNPDILFSPDWHVDHYAHLVSAFASGEPNRLKEATFYDSTTQTYHSDFVDLNRLSPAIWRRLQYPIAMGIVITEISSQILPSILSLLHRLAIGSLTIGKNPDQNFSLYCAFHLQQNILVFKDVIEPILDRCQVGYDLFFQIGYDEVFPQSPLSSFFRNGFHAYEFGPDSKIIPLPLVYAKDQIYSLAEQRQFRSWVELHQTEPHFLSAYKIWKKKIAEIRSLQPVTQTDLDQVWHDLRFPIISR